VERCNFAFERLGVLILRGGGEEKKKSAFGSVLLAPEKEGKDVRLLQKKTAFGRISEGKQRSATTRIPHSLERCLEGGDTLGSLREAIFYFRPCEGGSAATSVTPALDHSSKKKGEKLPSALTTKKIPIHPLPDQGEKKKKKRKRNSRSGRGGEAGERRDSPKKRTTKKTPPPKKKRMQFLHVVRGY